MEVAVGAAVATTGVPAYDRLAEDNTGEAKRADMIAGSLKGANWH